MKKLTVAIVFILCTITLSGCSSTNKTQTYKEMQADIAVMCQGNSENVEYIRGRHTTKVKCGGKVFILNKEDDEEGVSKATIEKVSKLFSIVGLLLI